MRISVKDFEQKFRGEGDAFEGVIHELVRAVGRVVGVASHDIDWDRRTNQGDGGRDLVVNVSHAGGAGHFIPPQPSVWSIKSGDDGIKPTSLRNEVTSTKHPKVREALLAGRSYVWCVARAASLDQRDAMGAEAVKVASALGFDPTLIVFRWQDAITAEVNMHPNLIAIHLPEVSIRIGNLLTLNEWGSEPGLRTGWADFGGREGVVGRVTEHLLGRGGQNVLQVAGLSGIGKTRTVLEACRRHEELRGVLYLERHEELTRDLYRYLEEDGLYVRLVIDETSLDEWPKLTSRLSNLGDRVRVVTIGPAVRRRQVFVEGILIVPEPAGAAEVLRVIAGSGGGLTDEVLRSIADQSRHDLRLALKLTEASQLNPEFRNRPVVDIDDIWDRLMTLFRGEVGDRHLFLRCYEALTVSVDVGCHGDAGDELAALAKYFSHEVDHLHRVAQQAGECGLGLRAGRFFEATPHALAVRLFETKVWPRLAGRIDEFMGVLPPRLLRRFLERCQGCSDDVREEVRGRVRGTFLAALDGAGVTALAGREVSRIFQAWAEFDPERGLAWLRRAAEEASAEQLRGIDGQADGSGGWRGRRQLVWLCQNLASFSEYFADCEAVLFRLAVHETEPSIGNNSAATWEHLFWPSLAGTEVPFEERLPTLLTRLRESESEQLPVVLRAAFGSFARREVGMVSPPRVVGGRVVPPPWNPSTYGELLTLRQTAADGVLDAIRSLPPGTQALALEGVVENLSVFRDLGRLERVRQLLPAGGLPEDRRRQLVIKLDDELSFLRDLARHPQQSAHPATPTLQEWRRELSTDDLATRVRDLTARSGSDVWGDAQGDPAAELARELVDDPATFLALEDWFDSPETKSVGAVGFHAGRLDVAGCLAGTVRDWLRGDRCRSATLTYLNGVSHREGGLPVEWAAELDALAGPRPGLVAAVTATADVSRRGLDRLLGVIDRLPEAASRSLRPLAYGTWHPVLTPEQQGRVLSKLNALSRAGDLYAPSVGIDLLSMWWYRREEPLAPMLVPEAVALAGRSAPGRSQLDDSRWLEVLRLLTPHRPADVARLIVEAVTEPGGLDWGHSSSAPSVMAAASARAPAGAMEAVGRALIDAGRRPMFGVCIYRGLFEGIGPDAVRGWVAQNGSQHIRWIARHLESPSVGPEGEAVVPPLTEWLFTEHEADQDAFEWFLMGRSNQAHVWTGDRTEERREAMRPFAQHPLRRVREWAEYEVDSEIREAKMFQNWDEEVGRG